jgi:hypothetical protein
MSEYGDALVEAFSAKVLKNLWFESVHPEFTNQDYEGEIKDRGTICNLMNFGIPAWVDYDGSDFNWDELKENPAKLVVDQQKVCKVIIRDIQQLKSWIKDPQSTFLQDIVSGLKDKCDRFIASKFTDVAAGNRVGTDYTAGTVAVSAAGVVTGTNTTFTAAMVGRGFRATGQSEWYVVSSFASATSITIKKDLADSDNTYDGGAISAGASYVIEAVSPLTATKGNIFSLLVAAQTKLDNSKVPTMNRNILLPPEIANLLELSTEINPSLPAEQFNALVVRGYVGQYAGFRIFKTDVMTGNALEGYHTLGAHRSWQTFAMAMNKSEVTKLEKNFGKGYKSLAVYGSKVADCRRKAGVELFVKPG